MAEFFLEIGTEEIPAGYMDPALKFLDKELTSFFGKNRIASGKAECRGTPRRLVVWMQDVAERQEDVVEVHTGPRVEAAYDKEGNPTKAALGFAKGKGIEVKDLEVEKTPKGDVICARVEKIGQPTAEVLNNWIATLIQSLPFPKKMRWAARPQAFVRPIHWISALFDGKPLSFDWDGIACGNSSKGHRFLKPDTFTFNSIDEYLVGCETHFIAVDPEARKNKIREDTVKLAKEVGGTIRDEAELLDTVTHLVEYPVPIRGEFDSKYLDLPVELLVITMKYHQKYFPVWKDDALLPYFITVSNMPANGDDLIINGNRRVLTARLEDARFFYDEDQKRPLEDYVEELKGVVFQKHLGTLYEKVERLALWVESFKSFAGDEVCQRAQRAARLCKADLVTQMVFEFPELQGVMGGYYARRHEEESVALAIKEHYRPNFAGDDPASSVEGALVALADKLDTIVGCIGVNLIPSGSEDPYALRRHALGIIQTLIHHNMEVSLEDLIDHGIRILGDKARLEEKEIRSHTLDLFRQRLKSMLAGEGMDYDVIDAVLATEIDSFHNVKAKAVAISKLKQEDYFESLATAFRRVVSILEGNRFGEVQSDLLQEKAEVELFEKYKSVKDRVQDLLDQRDFSSALAEIVLIKPEVDGFFDSVMVNADDTALRDNRKALLYAISRLFAGIADFSCLVVKKG